MGQHHADQLGGRHSKRRQDDDEKSSSEGKIDEPAEEKEQEIVNVDFDFFDPNPEVDFQALKQLLAQLFDADSSIIDLSSLTDIILNQSAVGSSVKTDGIESDPFAFLSVINIGQNKDQPAVQGLGSYLTQRMEKNSDISKEIQSLFTSRQADRTGLLISERLINMPTELLPAMYELLLSEMEKATEKGDPFDFKKFILISKTFREVTPNIASDEHPKKKKAKERTSECFYFHPEDEILRKHSSSVASFKYRNENRNTDSRRAFQEYGISPEGLIMLIDFPELQKAVGEMKVLFPPY